MKKEFLIMALISAIVLTLTTFPGNKAEAGYYPDFSPGQYWLDVYPVILFYFP